MSKTIKIVLLIIVLYCMSASSVFATSVDTNIVNETEVIEENTLQVSNELEIESINEQEQSNEIIEDKKELIYIDGIWRISINGKIDYNYTGLATNENGTYYLENGKITFKYNGICSTDTGDYVVEKSKVKTDCTEVMQVNGIWRMVVNGKVEYDYEGLGTNKNGAWYVKEGTIKFDYTDTFYRGDTAYIIEGNQIKAFCDKNTTEVMKIDNIWRMVINGKVDYNYTGIGINSNGTWYLENGKVTFKYTGVAKTNSGDYIVKGSKVQTDCTEVMQVNGIWRMVVNGKIEYDYDGIGTNKNGTWYVKEGTIKFDYTGTYYEGDRAYIVEGNKVKADFPRTGSEVVLIEKTWRMVIDGKVDYNYTGIGTNSNGTWYLENGKVTFKYTGVAKTNSGDYIVKGSKVQTDCTEVMQVNGIWRMVVNGKVEYDYDGIGTNSNGTWYVKEGTIKFDYTGTYYEGDRAYIVEGNKVKADFPKTGREVVKIDNIWRMVIDGKVDYNYTGLGTNKNGTWYLENGKVTFKYTGVAKTNTGDYIVKGSKVQTDCTEVMQVNGIWRMVENGKVEYDYDGIGTNSNGTWYVKEGTIKFDYTGTYYEGDKAYIIEGNQVKVICTKNTTSLMLVNKIWRMVINGEVDYKFEGLATNSNGTYILQNGEVNFKYNGEYKDSDGSVYTITNGKVTETIKNAKYPGTMWVDEPIQGNKYLSGSLNVSGWALSEEKNDIIKIYLDDKFIANASRRERKDVFEVYNNNEYGGKASTPKPGYYYSVNTSGLSKGNHSVKIVNYASDGKTVIQSRKVDFAITELTKTWGIDVSQYQGNINWSAVKNRGVDFAILRIGYYLESKGQTVIDPYFESNYNECKRLGIAVGGYFYSYAFNSSEASREASACISVIRGKHFEMPIFLDVEDNILKNGVASGKTNKNELTNASITFCDMLNNAGYRSGVYASKNFFRDYLNVSVLERYNIWLAHYTTSTDYTGKYDIWQYTSSGSIPGISGNVDLDWCFTRYY